MAKLCRHSRACATVTITVTAALVGPAVVEARAQAPANCSEARIAPHSACVSGAWVNAGESWLLAAEDEGTGGTICVYLSRWNGRSYAWGGAAASCDSEPTMLTLGAAGHPTVYNGTGHWITVVLAIFN